MRAGWILPITLVLTACTPTPGPVASPMDALTLIFDDSGARQLSDALAGPALTSAKAQEMLSNPGLAAMVDNSTRWVPEATRAKFVVDMVAFTGGQKDLRSPFALRFVAPERDRMLRLLDEVRANQSQISARALAKFRPFVPHGLPLDMRVYLVAGGVSDGFIMESSASPDLFIAADRAKGDVVGMEQNITHELVHILQKAIGRLQPGSREFLEKFEAKPAMDQFVTHTLWEGSANFAADARTMPAGGDYMKMWRERYAAQLDPATLRQSFINWANALVAVDRGTMTYQQAYSAGFSGNNGSPFYFVGMEMVRALVAAKGRGYLQQLFDHPPGQFLKDYAALAKADPSAQQLSPDAIAVIARLPHEW